MTLRALQIWLKFGGPTYRHQLEYIKHKCRNYIQISVLTYIGLYLQIQRQNIAVYYYTNGINSYPKTAPTWRPKKRTNTNYM